MQNILTNHPDIWRDKFPVWQSTDNKYTHGSALICGGGTMTGAARLAARAAQRIGAGLVTIAAPRSALPIYAEALESVIVLPCDDLSEWQNLIDNPKRTIFLLGPGLGLTPQNKQFVLAALKTKKSCVLDADALTLFADNPSELFAALHGACVLTPHQGEFARLFGFETDKDKIEQTTEAAKLAGCVVLLKGAETIIAQPEGVCVINKNAPPWLATGGTGDVLAGIITGLMAQKMSVFWAAAAAAWIHGECANLQGRGLIAEDLITVIPQILQGLS